MNNSVATIAIVWVVIFVGGCRAPSDTTRISKVSLVELLAKPAQYDGKRVSVSGFYHYEFESSGLYLSRDDARFGVLRNSVWVGDSTNESTTAALKSFNDSFIMVFGRVTYEADGVGHLGLFPVAVEEIDRVMILPDRLVGN